jgi:hypothetical protein
MLSDSEKRINSDLKADTPEVLAALFVRLFCLFWAVLFRKRLFGLFWAALFGLFCGVPVERSEHPPIKQSEDLPIEQSNNGEVSSGSHDASSFDFADHDGCISQQDRIGLESLPNEVIEIITTDLYDANMIRSLASLSLCSKRLQAVIEPQLWRNLTWRKLTWAMASRKDPTGWQMVE